MSRHLVSLLAAPALAALCAAPLVARQSPATFILDKVDVTGASRYTVADVVKVTGLKIESPVSTADLDVVAQRMAATGLFNSERYRYTTQAGRIAVTLEIAEPAWTVPVVFDNLVWFSEVELNAIVREAVPSFDGTTPASQNIGGYVAGVLQRALEARRLPGRVVAEPRVNLRTGAHQLLFVVKETGDALKMCALRVPGAASVPEIDLQKAAQSAMGTEYSRSFMRDLADGTLRQLYRTRGYWKAAFGSPAPLVGDRAGCSGVAVSIPVTEGIEYRWERAQWQGSTALSVKELDTLLGFKPSEVADATRLTDGLLRVHAAYEKQGYIQQKVDPSPVFDDATRRAVFEMVVPEGPQFHMGTVEFVGLDPKDAADLAKKWRLKPGEVYDASYLREFRSANLTPGRGAAPPSWTATAETRVNDGTHTVDVRFVFRLRS
jgi:outer membrane protein insertion porin family